jgi:uncharacterized protein (DUF885 family)
MDKLYNPCALRQTPARMTRFHHLLSLVVFASLSWAGGAANSPTNFTGKQAPAAAPVSLPDLIRDYEADERSVSNFYDLPWSEVRFERLEHLYHAWQGRLAAVDFARLDQQSRADYLLLRNEIERSLAGIARDRVRLAEMEPLLGFRGVIHGLESGRWRGQTVNGQAAADQVATVFKQVKQLKERIEKSRAKKPGTAAAEKAGNTKDKPAGAVETVGQSRNSPSPQPSPPGTVERGRVRSPLSLAGEGQGEGSAQNLEPHSKPAGELTSLPVTPALALRTAAAVDELRGTLKRWYEFYSGYQPDFPWWLKTPTEEASKQLEEFAKYLREEVAGQKGKEEDPLVGDPVGAAALAAAIQFEFLPYSAGELIAIGERELAWCETQRLKAARALGCSNNWPAALAKVKADFVPPGQQDELVTATARAAIEFTKKRRFATVPPLCAETWRLTMMSPAMLKTVPYAAYGGQNMMVAYAREDMKQEDKLMVMRGNNRAFTHLIVPHELIPGHHLQMFQGARHRQYRHGFGTPFYTEGWALYCELRFWDLGWARTPPERLGMLFWRMHRAARIIVSLKFHLGQMKPEEMVEFLVNRIGHERFGAISEVRRFISDSSPLYQAGYMIGGKQLVALHDELVPARLTEQQFNDAVLAAGPIPIELLRAELRQLPLARDSRPEWRFAGDKP